MTAKSKVFDSHRSIARGLTQLAHNLEASGIWSKDHGRRLVFLCGASVKDQSTGEAKPSPRRQALIDFAAKHLPHTKFLLAEDALQILRDGLEPNLLDFEDSLSRLADDIILILESPSAFAELGSFSVADLRHKLIIINDTAYRNEPSFINMGPIRAVQNTENGEMKVLHYKMTTRPGNNHAVDAIGDVFRPLSLLLAKRRTRLSRVPLHSIKPVGELRKSAALFMHDLVFMSGPITYNEIIYLLIRIFGDDDYKKAHHYLGFLLSTKFLDSRKVDVQGRKITLYKSNESSLFFDYKFDTNSVIAAFRNLLFKSYPERLPELR